jgi:hypothetical protein
MDRKPLNSDRIITLNCGLGRDSIAMLILCTEGKLEVNGLGTVLPSDLDCVVFSDTGCEWQHTYDVLPDVEELCEEHGIRMVTLHKEGEADSSQVATSWEDIEHKANFGAYHLRPSLMDDYQSRATVASICKGDCTDNHKIQPIRRLISDISMVRFGVNNRSYSAAVRRGERLPHITLIGIAADETERLAHGGNGPQYVTEAHPLVDMGVAKGDEQPILERRDLGHVRKSGCVCCPFQPLGWYWALAETDSEEWDRVVEYERVAMERNPRMAATGAKGPGNTPMTLPEAVMRWRNRNPEATVDTVLDKQYSRCLSDARKQRKAEAA